MRRPALRDRHAVVTGGSSGIGLALVRRLVEAGARVSVIALPDEALTGMGAAGVHTAGADVSDPAGVAAAVASCVATHGPCDLLVTCAGITHPGYFSELPDEVFERLMRVNYFGTLWPIRAVVPSMIERRRGAIVGVSSFAGLIGAFGYTAYGASKFAVRGLLETLRVEMKPHGILVAGVYPTDVDTPMLAYERPMMPPEALALTGTVKPISAEAVADAILDGIARRRIRIYPGRNTAVLARLAGAVPAVADRIVDRAVARARKAN